MGEYEKKLKEVSSDAMNKLQAFQAEHKALLEKTQYLLDKSTINIKEVPTPKDPVPTLIRQLHQEYQDVLVTGKNMVGDIYLVDVLARLHLINSDMTQERAREVFNFMDKSKQNILIKSDLEQYRTEYDDIQKNLFKVVCAILNLQVNQRDYNYMEPYTLNTYLDAIKHVRDDQDLVLINQLATIKNLINRPVYSLSDMQVRQIHLKFKNMADER